MENRGSTDDVDDVAKDSPRDGIQEHNFAEEFLSDLPSVAMSSSAPSGSSSAYASSVQVPSAAKVDDRDDAHGGSAVSDVKKLEHALRSGPMQLSAGFGMVDSIERPPVVYASNLDVAPGAFPVRSARNTTAAGRTFRSPMSSHDPPREFTTEEFKQDEGVTTSAAAGIGLYAVEAQRVPDGNDDGTVMVAEAQYISSMKWYQRRWIVVGLALCACGFAAAVVVLVVRPQSASSGSSLMSPPTFPMIEAPPTPVPSEDAPPTRDPTTASPITGAPATPDPTTAPPTTAPITGAPATPDPTTASPITGAPITSDPTAVPPTLKPISTAPPTRAPTIRVPSTLKPTSLTSVANACNFLSIPDVTTCRSTFVFDSYDNANDETTASSIPSEIGLLTQLTGLRFYANLLTSSIPSEIGLLTQLEYLSFYNNALTSSIPSEIGLLTQLTWLDFSSNSLTSSIPSEIGLLTQLTWLNFWDNLLTSTIPSEIGLLTQMLELFAWVNSLTSSIPSEIGRLTQLTYLGFSDNALSGTIPSSLCSLPSPPTIWIDIGEITCASGCCLDGSDWNA